MRASSGDMPDAISSCARSSMCWSISRCACARALSPGRLADPVRVMVPFLYMAESSHIQSAPDTSTVFVTGVDVTDPTVSSLATLTVNIPADVARTVVILDKVGGGVEARAIEN